MKHKNRHAHRHKSTRKGRYLLIFLVFCIGVCIIAYPFLGDRWNQQFQDVVLSEYEAVLAAAEEESIAAEKEAAREYNAAIIGNVILTDPFDFTKNTENAEEYLQLLDISGNGMMGSIRIPSINVELAVFHGTGSDVLSRGVGHLENTSLPVGGAGTHAVMSAHTGHPTARFFDNLIKLKEGDVFYLSILDEVLAYEVDQIKTVEPEDSSDLHIDRAKDYVTLVTCTPYGVNSHRLLVRGHRIPYVEPEEPEPLPQSSRPVWHWFAGAGILLAAGILAAVCIHNKKQYKPKRGRK